MLNVIIPYFHVLGKTVISWARPLTSDLGAVLKVLAAFFQHRPTGDLTVNDLVKWMTGTKTVPVRGFPKKFSITFVHGWDASCRCRPTSTCDLLLKMPVQSPVCTGIWHWFSIFDAMVEMMSSGLQNGVFIMVQFYPWFNFYSPLVF